MHTIEKGTNTYTKAEGFTWSVWCKITLPAQPLAVPLSPGDAAPPAPPQRQPGQGEAGAGPGSRLGSTPSPEKGSARGGAGGTPHPGGWAREAVCRAAGWRCKERAAGGGDARDRSLLAAGAGCRKFP